MNNPHNSMALSIKLTKNVVLKLNKRFAPNIGQVKTLIGANQNSNENAKPFSLNL